MSELSPMLTSAVNGASFVGPDAVIFDLGPVGMITVRGDLTSKAFTSAVTDVTGGALPGIRGFEVNDLGGIGWMSPDELLLVCDYENAAATTASLQKAQGEQHSLVVNVSDARTMFRLEGAGVRELIAKGAPVDMSPDAFGPGDLRRSRLGQVAAAFWAEADGSFRLVCFRSVGAYVFDWLCASAKDGMRPGLF
ncbi:MAG: sarcosine oxidase subunit gamma family protein [Pseudomonadota bacterium]